jgi:hypothetical protein
VLAATEDGHRELAEHGVRVADLAEAWRSDPSASNRAALHVELIALERAVLRHLAVEEADALPLPASVNVR